MGLKIGLFDQWRERRVRRAVMGELHPRTVVDVERANQIAQLFVRTGPLTEKGFEFCLKKLAGGASFEECASALESIEEN